MKNKGPTSEKVPNQSWHHYSDKSTVSEYYSNGSNFSVVLEYNGVPIVLSIDKELMIESDLLKKYNAKITELYSHLMHKKNDPIAKESKNTKKWSWWNKREEKKARVPYQKKLARVKEKYATEQWKYIDHI